MPLSPPQTQLLKAIGEGATLKAHRDLDGQKLYRLHPLDPAADPLPADPETVQSLVRTGYLTSSWKFPANTFYLTDKGRAAAEAILGRPVKPLGTRGIT